MINNKLFLPEKLKTAKSIVSRYFIKNNEHAIINAENKIFKVSSIIDLSKL